MLSQTSMSQVSLHIQIFIPMKASFFWKGNQQFNYCNKLSRRKIKDGRYSEAATESHIGILSFFVKISEKYLWKSLFLAMVQAIGVQFY